MMFSFLKRNRDLETPEYQLWRQQFMQKRLSLGMRIAFFYFVTLLGEQFIYLLRGSTHFSQIWLITILIILAAIIYGTNHLKRLRSPLQTSLIFLSISWTITILIQLVDTISKQVKPEMMLIWWMVTFFSQATLVPVRWRFHLISQLGGLAYYFIVNIALGIEVIPNNIPTISWFINIFWTCFISNISVYLYEKLAKSEFYARNTSEKLLLNILPESIAMRLKDDENTIADSFTDVTVLFADIVGFTQLSSHLPPDQVVEFLNQIFSHFDRLVEIHQLEKIKTIGDAYLVVSGLPYPRPDHTEAIADMAIDMQIAMHKFNQETGKNLNIRIGIHTGPVVAGVIGLKKFAYDLWGDTVNTASRMESHGVAGKIQVSASAYERLKHLYKFEERGVITVKGKGDMTTYFLLGKVLGTCL
jgi:adenylate cyclase